MILTKEEGLGKAQCNTKYMLAGIICAAHSDLARAYFHFMGAHANYEYCKGEDDQKVILVEKFVDDPSLHVFFAMSKMWETTYDDIPKADGSIDENGFGDWLWRRETPSPPGSDSSTGSAALLYQHT